LLPSRALSSPAPVNSGPQGQAPVTFGDVDLERRLSFRWTCIVDLEIGDDKMELVSERTVNGTRTISPKRRAPAIHSLRKDKSSVC